MAPLEDKEKDSMLQSYEMSQSNGQEPQPSPGSSSIPLINTWIQVQPSIPHCPRGLEALHTLDQLVCHQKVNMAEVFTTWEATNKYVIRTVEGQQVYYAFEESDMCVRQCCGSQRGYTVHIVNNLNQEVLTIKRPFKCLAHGFCWTACGGWFSQKTKVFLPDGTFIGSVVQRPGCFLHNFHILDLKGRHQLTVSGRAVCACFSVEYAVKSRDGTKIGHIKKKFSGVGEEWYTNADRFGVKFPMDLDVTMKATLLAATFLIDFMVFEE